VRAKKIAAVLAFAAIVVLCSFALPGAAAAKPGFYKVPASTTEQIGLRGSHGYRVSLSVVDRRATLSATKSTGHHGVLSTFYALRHRLAVGPDLDFRLGGEGRVDLRFVRDHTVEHRYPECTGGPEISEVGHFVGTIRLRGRQGYTRVESHRASGSVTRVSPRTCHRDQSSSAFGIVADSGKARRPGVPKDTLELIAGTADGHLHLTAYRFEQPGFAEAEIAAFQAWIRRREGDLSVTSSAIGIPFGKRFVSPEPGRPLSAATISPAAPFSGSATFQLTSPHHAEWSGDLAVELPGYGRMPLTGPKIRAGLCETDACTPTLPKSLRPRIGAEKKDAAGHFKVSYFNGG
jgi:hypothetical protein